MMILKKSCFESIVVWSAISFLWKQELVSTFAKTFSLLFYKQIEWCKDCVSYNITYSLISSATIRINHSFKNYNNYHIVWV